MLFSHAGERIDSLSHLLSLSSSSFASSPLVPLGDCPFISVDQQEYCLVDLPSRLLSPITLLSHDTTSCVILAAISGNGARACVAHLDSDKYSPETLLHPILNDTASGAQARPASLYLVGGLRDKKEYGRRILTRLLSALSAAGDSQDPGGATATLPDLHPGKRIRLELACLDSHIADPSTGRCICRELAVVVPPPGSPQPPRALRPDPKSAAALLPALPGRRARLWCSGRALDGSYAETSPEGKLWRVECTIEVPSGHAAPDFSVVLRIRGWRGEVSMSRLRLASYVLHPEMPDSEVLRMTSTTPDDEGEGYVEGVRNAFRWMVAASQDARSAAHNSYPYGHRANIGEPTEVVFSGGELQWVWLHGRSPEAEPGPGVRTAAGLGPGSGAESERRGAWVWSANELGTAANLTSSGSDSPTGSSGGYGGAGAMVSDSESSGASPGSGLTDADSGLTGSEGS